MQVTLKAQQLPGLLGQAAHCSAETLAFVALFARIRIADQTATVEINTQMAQRFVSILGVGKWSGLCVSKCHYVLAVTCSPSHFSLLSAV